MSWVSIKDNFQIYGSCLLFCSFLVICPVDIRNNTRYNLLANKAERRIYMQYKCTFDEYNSKITIRKLFSDSSELVIFEICEESHNMHFKILTDNMRYFIEFCLVTKLFPAHRTDITIEKLYAYLICSGYFVKQENK